MTIGTFHPYLVIIVSIWVLCISCFTLKCLNNCYVYAFCFLPYLHFALPKKQNNMTTSNFYRSQSFNASSRSCFCIVRLSPTLLMSTPMLSLRVPCFVLDEYHLINIVSQLWKDFNFGGYSHPFKVVFHSANHYILVPKRSHVPFHWVV